MAVRIPILDPRDLLIVTGSIEFRSLILHRVKKAVAAASLSRFGFRELQHRAAHTLATTVRLDDHQIHFEPRQARFAYQPANHPVIVSGKNSQRLRFTTLVHLCPPDGIGLPVVVAEPLKNGSPIVVVDLNGEFKCDHDSSL